MKNKLSIPCVLDGKEPTKRWGHTLTMIAEDEAVLIGGQGDKQQFSRDSCWLLDLGKLTYIRVTFFISHKN